MTPLLLLQVALASIFHLLIFAQGLNAVQNIQNKSTCWLPSPAYWLLPVGFHLQLVHSRLLAVAC